MHIQTLILAIIMLAVGTGAWLARSPSQAEAERLEILTCWHEVAVNRRLSPGECRFL